jgi:hypothetical protein
VPPTVNRNEQWAIDQFRPLLNEIDISNIPASPNYLLLRLSRYEHLRNLGLSDCVLIVRRRIFKSTVNGYYTFSYRMAGEQPIFFLSIFLNDQLFVSNTPAQKIRRRQALVHEFTHCIAAFLLMEMPNREKNLIDKLTLDLVTHTKLNIRNHYQSLIIQFGSGQIPMANVLGVYPDEHFRLDDANFQGSFATLYKHLILDFSIFEKYFTPEYRDQFKEHIQNGNVDDALMILNIVCYALVSCEFISADFVKLRVREQLLQHYYLEAIKEVL